MQKAIKIKSIEKNFFRKLCKTYEEVIYSVSSLSKLSKRKSTKKYKKINKKETEEKVINMNDLIRSLCATYWLIIKALLEAVDSNLESECSQKLKKVFRLIKSDQFMKDNNSFRKDFSMNSS